MCWLTFSVNLIQPGVTTEGNFGAEFSRSNWLVSLPVDWQVKWKSTLIVRGKVFWAGS